MKQNFLCSQVYLKHKLLLEKEAKNEKKKKFRMFYQTEKSLKVRKGQVTKLCFILFSL